MEFEWDDINTKVVTLSTQQPSAPARRKQARIDLGPNASDHHQQRWHGWQ